METTLVSTPKMDWESGDLPTAWKSFKQHVQFMFDEPLKGKNEEAKCNYLMIWVGNKGCEIYSTWNLQQAESKLLKTHYVKFENYVKQSRINCMFTTNFHKEDKQKQKYSNNL